MLSCALTKELRMTTPPDEPVQPKPLVRLANALGLSSPADLAISPEQRDRHQKTIAAMELMRRNHLHAFVSYDAFRRQLLELVNQAKAEDPVGAKFLDDFAKESLADYSDELKLLVAAQN